MNIRIATLGLVLLSAAAAASAPAGAGNPEPPARIVVDCARPVLPGLRRVSGLVDRHNAGQVYAIRARLMLDARRACRRPGVSQVQLVHGLPARRHEAPRLAAGGR